MWTSLLLLTQGLSMTLSGPSVYQGDQPVYNKGLFEGDIMISEDRNAVVDEQKLWPGGIVFYELDASVEPIRRNILNAMKEIENKTCIQFLPKISFAQDYVRLENWDGCWSAVGRQGGEQITSLGFGCHFQGILLHELGHIIGLYHEHSRSDRDDYIEIFWENVESGMDGQLLKMKQWEHNLLLEDFDYESVMLYGEDAFSKEDGLPTIVAKEPGVTIGPLWTKPHLSSADVRRINRLYQCFGEVRPPAPDTPNFLCTFEEYCELKRLTTDLRLEVFNSSLKTGNVLLVETKKESDKQRFATPFLEVFGQTTGCFSLDYYFPRNPTTYLRIMKQDLDGTIELANIIPERLQFWQRLEKNILLPEFGLRFIIEVQGASQVETSGIVFLDNLSFSLHAFM